MPNSAHDLYAVLGVPRSASPGSIRRAYRQRALSTHPDKGGSAGQFRLVVLAFETLGSVLQRQQYDRRTAPSESLLATGAHDGRRAQSKACPRSADCERAAGDAKRHTRLARKRSATLGSRQNLRTPARSRSRSRRQGRRDDAQGSSQTRASSGSQGGRIPVKATDSTNTTRRSLATRAKQLRSALDKLNRLLQIADGPLRRSLFEAFPPELKKVFFVFKQRQCKQQPQQQDGQQRKQQREQQCEQQRIHKTSGTITDLVAADAHEAAEMSDAESHASSAGSSLISADEPLPAVQDVVLAPRRQVNNDGFCDTSPAEQPHLGLEDACLEPQHHVMDDPDLCEVSTAASQQGIIARKCRGGTWRYQTVVYLHCIRIRSRWQHSLEAAVNAHVALVQVRDAVREAFRSNRSCLDGIGMESEAEVSAREVASIAQSVFAEHGFRDDSCFCSYSWILSLRAFIREKLATPATRSLQVCLMHRHRLQAARKLGWKAFREAWIDLVANMKERIPGARGRMSGNRSRECVAAYLDAAYENYQEKRASFVEPQARKVADRAYRLIEAMARARERRRQSQMWEARRRP